MMCWAVLSSFHIVSCVFIGSFFFFKQKTAYEMRISDWSSDVCSSDLVARVTVAQAERDGAPRPPHRPARDRAAAVILRDRLAIDAANRLAPLPPRRRRR